MNEAIITLQESIACLEDEKQKYEDSLPKIIKFYGLDPKTIEAKSAYLLAHIKLGFDNNLNNAYELLSPYMKPMI